jgi:hypothetical protein
VLGVGVGVAVAHAIAEGGAIAVGIAQVRRAWRTVFTASKKPRLLLLFSVPARYRAAWARG